MYPLTVTREGYMQAISKGQILRESVNLVVTEILCMFSVDIRILSPWLSQAVTRCSEKTCILLSCELKHKCLEVELL